jgi:hypothetical protein
MNTPRKSKFRHFVEARAFVQGLKFQGKNDYAICSKTPDRPNDIPTTPAQVYKAEWISWGDWLIQLRLYASTKISQIVSNF